MLELSAGEVTACQGGTAGKLLVRLERGKSNACLNLDRAHCFTPSVVHSSRREIKYLHATRDQKEMNGELPSHWSALVYTVFSPQQSLQIRPVLCLVVQNIGGENTGDALYAMVAGVLAFALAAQVIRDQSRIVRHQILQ